MIVLFDTDVILKLAALDLLGVVCRAIGVKETEVCVPPGSVYKLRKDRGGRMAGRYGVEGLARAVEFLGQASTCAVDPERLASLSLYAGRADVTGLDAGEVMLLSSVIPDGGCVLASGDKRWPPALQADEPACRLTCDIFEGAVICFEHAMLHSIALAGFPAVHTVFLAFPTCDETLRLVFTSRPEAVEEAVVVEGLASNIRSLRQTSGSLLADHETLLEAFA